MASLEFHPYASKIKRETEGSHDLEYRIRDNSKITSVKGTC